jgi:uncharacterized protein involved in copper resistance
MRKLPFRRLDFALLFTIGPHQPLVLIEGEPRSVEDGAAVEHGQARVHAQAQAFEESGEVPGIDCMAVDSGGPPHGFEARAMEHGRKEGMAHKGLVEPGNGAARPDRRNDDEIVLEVW